MALTRMVSMGSVGAAILFPVLVLFMHTNFTVSEGTGYLIYSIILAIIVAFNHRSNIKRILNGTENKLRIMLEGKDEKIIESKSNKTILNKEKILILLSIIIIMNINLTSQA